MAVLPVWAEETTGPYRVSTRVDPCVPIDVERFKRLLNIELGSATEPSEQTQAPPSVAAVSLTCVADGIQIALVDAVTQKSVTRVIDLDSVRLQYRTRLMAVTVSELVLASWLELRLFVPETIEPAGPPPPVAVQQSAARRVDQSLGRRDAAWQLSAAFDLMMFSSAPQLIAGVGARLSHPLSDALTISLGADIGWGQLYGYAPGQPGRVALRLTTSSLQASLLYAGRLDDFELSIGAGGRIGLAQLAGTPTSSDTLQPETSYAPWGGPVLVLGAVYRVGVHFRIVANVEAGWVTRRIRAIAQDSATQRIDEVARLSGAWGLASLGVGWSF